MVVCVSLNNYYIYSAKVSCNTNDDCGQGFRCAQDLECAFYTFTDCTTGNRVCMNTSVRPDGRTGCCDWCYSDNDCDTGSGFRCMMGIQPRGMCIKYQSHGKER